MTERMPDRPLIGAVAGLLVVGLLMVYSASFVMAHNEFGDDSYFLVRQLLWIGISALGAVIVARIDYHHWQRISVLLLLLSLVTLVLVLIPSLGSSSYGARRWLGFGPFSFQPSELAKLALAIYLADWLSRKGDKVRNLSYGTIPFAIIVSLFAVLIMLEPDMGTTVLLAAMSVSIFFVGGANLLHFVLGLAGGALVLYSAILNAGYRSERLKVFLNPWTDPQDSGWHTIQTLIALGSGGPTGLGLGMSRQKAYWVPNAHTDAIFAIIGEELGLIGTVTVLALFGLLAWRGIAVALRSPDLFGRLLAAGVTAMLVWQALVNIAVVTNTVPYTGVPLPFISFGGSSLLVSMLAAGLLLSVSRHANASTGEGDLAVLEAGGGGRRTERGQDGGGKRTPEGRGSAVEPGPGRPAARPRSRARVIRGAAQGTHRA
jgi:cell division protein FtsW